MWLVASQPDQPRGNVDLDGLLAAAAASALLVAAGISLFRWHVEGRTPALWIAAAMALTSTSVALGDLAPFLVDGDEVLRAGGAASFVVLVALCVQAARSPAVDPQVRPLQVVLLSGALTAVVLAGFLVLDVRWPRHLPFSSVEPAATLVVATAWAGLAILCTVRSSRGGGWTFAWFGLFAAVAAFHEVVISLSAARDRTLAGGHMSMLLLGALLVTYGTIRDLQCAFTRQRAELLTTRATAVEAGERARVASEETAHRVHDARNALMAIGGAARTLEQYHDRLPSETRAVLARGVDFEIGRLQRLISMEVQVTAREEFVLAEAIAPVVTRACATQQSVTVALPDRLVLIGSWAATAEIVQELFDNALQHSGSSEVRIEALARDDGTTAVRVIDPGVGIPLEERETIFEWGTRGTTAGPERGSGLGLYRARRLAVQQGGSLTVVDDVDAGAVLEIVLPSARSVGDDDVLAPPTVDRRQHLAEMGDVDDVMGPAHRGVRNRISVGRRHDQHEVGLDADR